MPSTAACVATVDPATSLATGAFKFGELAGRDDSDELWALLEYGDVEPTSYVQLSRTGVTAVGMHVLTSGDVQRSRRVRELVQSSLGCTDELRVLASTGQQVWGGMALFRDDAAVPYAAEDVAFVSSLSALLARGLRVGLSARLASAPPASAYRGPAVMVFGPDGELRQASVGAEERLARVVGGDQAPLPSAVLGSLVARGLAVCRRCDRRASLQPRPPGHG